MISSQHEESAKLQRRVEAAEKKLAQTQIEHTRLKYILPVGISLALCVGFISRVVGLGIGILTCAFFAVGHYLNFFHRREARSRLEHAQFLLQEQHYKPKD
jgi:F0F1-type ATP synthase assembly protein I